MYEQMHNSPMVPLQWARRLKPFMGLNDESFKITGEFISSELETLLNICLLTLECWKDSSEIA